MKKTYYEIVFITGLTVTTYGTYETIYTAEEGLYKYTDNKQGYFTIAKVVKNINGMISRNYFERS